MTDRITKAITVMSSAYEIKSSIRSIFYSRKHFPKVLGASMLCAFIGSYSMMESIHQGRLKEQEQKYSEAWEVYAKEKERHNEQYETALRPTALQKRRFTKIESSAVVFLSPLSKQGEEESIDRVRRVQE